MAGRLLVLEHRSGLKLQPLRVVDLKGEHLLCGRASCPHFHGQLSLLPDAPPEMYCAVDGGAISQTCHPYYLEGVETLSSLYRRGDKPRKSAADLLAELEEVEVLEARRRAAAQRAGVGG